MSKLAGLVGVASLIVAVLALGRDIFDIKRPWPWSASEQGDDEIIVPADRVEAMTTHTNAGTSGGGLPSDSPRPTSVPGEGFVIGSTHKLEPAPDITLSNGASQLIASDRATISARFNRIGEEEFVTFVIASDSELKTEAVLAPGRSFTFEAGGEIYQATVMDIDFAAQEARMRIAAAEN